jgi:transcriptional regulator with XRE-family HTH domain
MTQSELARRVGLSQPRVSQVEHAAADVSLTRRTLVAFADALGVILADLGIADASSDEGPRGDHDVRAS